MSKGQPLWGIDLGGTKTEGVIMPSLDSATPILRVQTEKDRGYRHILGQIQKLVEDMKQQSGLSPERIGLGTPGILDPQLNTLKNSNTTALNGQPLKRDIEALLQVPVVIANDANCFALAETHWGIVKESYPAAKMVFGIIMGTGVGGGIVTEGKIWNGHHGIGGEWGHIYLDESGGRCYCGRVGCVETILSGPALERYYATLSGVNRKLSDIVSRTGGTDLVADQTINRLHHFFGKALSIVTNLLDPDVIIIGGGVGNIDSIYTEGVASLRQHIFNNRLDVPVVRPLLGDSAGVFGAAALVV